MTRKLAPLLALVAAVLFASAAPAEPQGLRYTITPELTDGRLVDLRITTRLPTGPGQTYSLLVPDDQMFEGDAVTYLVQGGDWVGGDRPKARRLVVKASTSEVAITYQLNADKGGDMRATNQRTLVRATGFSVRGEDVLLIPEGFERRTATVNLHSVPTWSMMSSIGGPTPVERVGDTHFLGGADYRTTNRKVDGAVFSLTYPGNLAASSQAMLDSAIRIMTVERQFWRTPAKPIYIGVVELRDDEDYSGRGLRDGFMLYLGKNGDQKSVLRLIAHENLHGWISRAIGGFPAVDSDLEAWLHEGFTEAYTARLLLQSGLWSLQDYVDDWNLALARYGTSPVKTAPNSRILADRQRDFDINWLPYDRGRLLAVTWDRAFRQATRGRAGLDDVLRAQIAEAGRLERAGRGVSADRLFPIVARRVTGLNLAADLARYVDQGEALTLARDAFGPCMDVVETTQPVFDRGFDLDATFSAGGRVTGLEPGGPAEQAGLRAGDKIRIDEIPTHDSRVTLSYRVDDGGGRSHTVRYRPEGRTTVTFQQLALKRGATSDCHLP